MTWQLRRCTYSAAPPCNPAADDRSRSSRILFAVAALIGAGTADAQPQPPQAAEDLGYDRSYRLLVYAY